jgi:uncharacterized protein
MKKIRKTQTIALIFLVLAGLGLSGLRVAAAPSAEEFKKIKVAIPDQSTAKPKKPRKLLVFSIAWGYKHSAIPYGKAAITAMAKKTKAFEVTVSDDLSHFEPANLKGYDAVVFNNTNNEIFLPANFGKLQGAAREQAIEKDKRLKKSLVDFLAGGKGLMVIHAGVASFRQWPEYGKIIGARFENHPWNAGSTITLKIEDSLHPLSLAFPTSRFEVTDEIYQFKEFDRRKLRVLFSIDTSGLNLKNKAGIRRTDGDFALSWIKDYGKGRVFYSALGHQHDIFWDKTILQHYLDGIQYALGDLPATAESIPAPKQEARSD